METYALNPGNHNLVWKYAKDGSVTSGSDTGWIDNLVISSTPTTTTTTLPSTTTTSSTTTTTSTTITTTTTTTTSTTTTTVPTTTTTIIGTTTTTIPAETASYNPTLGAPECTTGASPCAAPSSLLQCNDNQAGGPEPNTPNTIDSDTDSTNSGTCHQDESVESITIESLTHSYIGQGDQVKVDITIYCYGPEDRWAICYTNDVSSISWQNKTILTNLCTGTGYETKTVTFDLDNVPGQHAVRAINRYGWDIPSCSYSTNDFNDFDDLAFVVI